MSYNTNSARPRNIGTVFWATVYVRSSFMYIMPLIDSHSVTHVINRSILSAMPSSPNIYATRYMQLWRLALVQVEPWSKLPSVFKSWFLNMVRSFVLKEEIRLWPVSLFNQMRIVKMPPTSRFVSSPWYWSLLCLLWSTVHPNCGLIC